MLHFLPIFDQDESSSFGFRRSRFDQYRDRGGEERFQPRVSHNFFFQFHDAILLARLERLGSPIDICYRRYRSIRACRASMYVSPIFCRPNKSKNNYIDGFRSGSPGMPKKIGG